MIHVVLVKEVLDRSEHQDERSGLVTFKIALKAKPKVIVQDEFAPKKIIKPKKKVKPVPKKKKIERHKPDLFDATLLIDSYTSGDKEVSTNNSDPSANEIDYGIKQAARVKQEAKNSSEKEKKFRELVVSESSVKKAVSGLDGRDNKDTVEGDVLGEKDEVVEKIISDGKLEEVVLEAESTVDEDVDVSEEFLGLLGNMTQLSEVDLGNAFVQDPFSANHGKKVRLVNKVIARIAVQISAKREKYFKGKDCPAGGEIWVWLSPYGKLIEAKLIKSCGKVEVDQSWFDALRKIKTFNVHFNPKINERHFSRLKVKYGRASNTKIELMPYEIK